MNKSTSFVILLFLILLAFLVFYFSLKAEAGPTLVLDEKLKVTCFESSQAIADESSTRVWLYGNIVDKQKCDEAGGLPALHVIRDSFGDAFLCVMAHRIRLSKFRSERYQYFAGGHQVECQYLLEDDMGR